MNNSPLGSSCGCGRGGEADKDEVRRMDTSRLHRGYEKSRKAAEEMVNDPESVREKVEAAEAKLERTKKGPLGAILEEIKLMIALVKDFIQGRYRDIAMGTIVTVLGGLLYFLSPIDLIPDFLAGIGFVDDAAVLGFVLKNIHGELEKYSLWKANNNTAE